jgi:hypothetical protein
MQRFKSSSQAQRFLSPHAFIYGYFHPGRHRMAANRYRASRESTAVSRLMIEALAFTADWDIILERHALARRVC